MANMKELSAGFKEFWEQQPGGDDITERFKEFQVGLWRCRFYLLTA